MAELALLVHEAVEYVDRELATASWWDRYILAAGQYPIRFTTVGLGVVPDGQLPYYAVANIDAVLVEMDRVSRLFTASIASTRTATVPRKVRFCQYAHLVKPGLKVYDGAGEVIELGEVG
jgi:hypothetical protein